MRKSGSGWIGCAMVLLALAGAAPAGAASVSVGHSGWFWGNPQPQGNTLSGLDFAGTRGYAAGEFGTLLRTDDGGATWSGINTGLTEALVRVRAIDPNTVVVGGGCALRRSDDGGQSFRRLPWTASDRDCPSPIASFSFPSGQVGYLLTQDGSVFRTGDGGQTFSRQTSVPGTGSTGGTRSPQDVFFTGDATGIAVASGVIFRTTDSGNSWQEVADAGIALSGIAFPSASDGFVTGANTTLLHTTDGGATWSQEPLAGAPSGADLSVIDCADPNLCLMVDRPGSRLIRTTDAGATGAAITPATGKVLSAAFASASRAVAVGERGLMVVSDDGGATYTPIGGELAGLVSGRLRATSSQVANIGGANGILARTLNGGVDWSTVGVPTTAFVTDASFPTADVGFAIDEAGGAFKTVNGGSSWQILNSGTSVSPRAVLATGTSSVLLVGPRSIRRSTDGGGSFGTVGDRDLKTVSLINAEPAGGAVVAYGRHEIVVSGDQGAHWRRVDLPGRRKKEPSLADVSFVSGRTGFILTRESALLRTTNGGRRWKNLPGLGPASSFGISFSSRASGYATSNRFPTQGPFGFALHTTNGGNSFQPQLISAIDLADLWDAGSAAYAAASDGSLFATNTGGTAGTPSALTLKQKGGPKARATKNKVKLAGTLSPAEGGEEIVVAVRARGGRWVSHVETAATSGQFTSTFTLRKPGVAVAQWIGDDTRAGAGTRAVTVRPPKRKPK